MKYFLSFMIAVQLLVFQPASSFGLRLYTRDEYRAARDQAVKAAREGNYESSLHSFERLLTLEPDNLNTLNDYITILIWNKQYGKALAFSPRLNLQELPEYVLRSLIIAAEKTRQSALSDELVGNYFARYPVVPDDTPENIAGKNGHEIALLTFRAGMTQTTLSILKLLHRNDPGNQLFLAEYIAVLSKDKQHEKALQLFPEVDPATAPEFVFDALIESAEQLKKSELKAEIIDAYQQRFSAPASVIPVPSPKKVVPKASKAGPKPIDQPRQSEAISPDVPPAAISVFRQEKTVPEASKVKEKSIDHLRQSEAISSESASLALARHALLKQDYAKAEKLLLPIYLAGVKSRSLLSLMAQLFDGQKKYLETAYVYQQLLEIEPENEQWRRGLVLSLFWAGAPFRALEILQDSPSLFSETEINKMKTDTDAFRLRWSRYFQAPGTTRIEALDAVLAEIEQSISRLRKEDDPYNFTRLQMDYIVALGERNRTQGVLDKYEELLAEKKDIPGYVLRIVASAFLDQRQPERARDIYQQLLEQDPDSFELKKSLFYAYFDNGEYREGLELVKNLEAATPQWRKDHSGGIVKENSEKLQAAILAANGLAYTDDLAAAQERYEEMLTAAPYNPELHDNLAMVYRWRGWPQKAYDEISIGRTIEPDNLYLAISKVRTLMGLYRFQEAEEELSRLVGKFPENKYVLELQEDYQLRDKRQLRVWVDGGNSDAAVSDQGSSDLSIDSYLYDKYYQQNFRPFIHQYYTASKFEEGIGRYERFGIGTEYKRNRNAISVEVSSSYSGSSDVGFSARGNHEVSDEFSLSLAYDSFSTNIPVRAYFHGIDGSAYKVGASYRLHESTGFTVSYEYLDFSDSNRRNSWSVAMDHRLVNRPTYKMIFTPSFYQSTNSRAGAPYYNPEEDQAISISIINEWLSYHHYETSLKQVLEIRVGQYYQKHFGTDLTNAILYRHQWVMSKSLEFSYGLSVSHDYYDGEKETRLAGTASLRWMF